ncbi:MAG: hypothetical protein RIC15_06705 [Vicingaceae bacterium]
MKTLSTVLVSLLFSSLALSQEIMHDLTIYSEDGEEFLVFNGDRQINAEYSATVEISNITEDQIKPRIKFRNESIEDLTGSISMGLSPEGGRVAERAVWVIKKNKKGAYKLRFESKTLK